MMLPSLQVITFSLWMITCLSRTVAAERDDDTLATPPQAGRPWSSASVMTTKTVILMEVFPLLEPDIITDNCPLISQLSWHILPYVCKSMRTLEVVGSRQMRGTVCGWGVGRGVGRGVGGESITVDFINHTVKCQRAGRKVKPPDCVFVCVCVALPRARCIHNQKMQKLYIKDWH